MKNYDEIRTDDYAVRIQTALYNKYKVRFRLGAIRIILRYVMTNFVIAIKGNREIYIRSRFSIYLSKDLIAKKGNWSRNNRKRGE